MPVVLHYFCYSSTSTIFRWDYYSSSVVLVLYSVEITIGVSTERIAAAPIKKKMIDDRLGGHLLLWIWLKQVRGKETRLGPEKGMHSNCSKRNACLTSAVVEIRAQIRRVINDNRPRCSCWLNGISYLRTTSGWSTVEYLLGLHAQHMHRSFKYQVCMNSRHLVLGQFTSASFLF
jgi:hypothetical protein